MAHSITTLAASFKRHYVQLLPPQVIDDACRQAGHRWRKRRFDPAATIYLFLLQILHGNTAILHLRHLSGAAINAAAYCKARMRLSLGVFEALLDCSAAVASAGCEPLLRSMRIFLVDATSSLAPDTPSIRKLFEQPANLKPGCGYPMAKVLALLDAASGAILRGLICSLYVHEASNVWGLHPRLRPGDLLVGDRAFGTYVHLVLLQMRGVFGLFRVYQNQKVDFRAGRRPGGKGRPTSRFVRKLGKWDQLVQWVKPQQRPKWMSRKQFDALPAMMLVREVRYRLEARGQRTRLVTIVTTLLDPALYPAETIAHLYGLRWQIETHFGQLKTTMKMSRLKCQTAIGVKKELLMYFIVYNLICRVIRDAARQQEAELRRISFIDALRWLASARIGQTLAVLALIPLRPDRHEPRVIKYLKYRYRTMTKPRAILKKRPYRYGGKIK